MNHVRSRLPLHVTLAAVMLAVSACSTASKPVSLNLDSRLLGGTEAKASIDVPGNWFQETRKGNRAVFVGPDNFSRVYFSTLESLTPVGECDSLVRRAIEEFRRDHSRGSAVEAELTPASGLPQVVYDFTMTVPGNPPGPTDRHFVGRASCDAGGIALVGCSVGRNRVQTLGKTCNEIVASLKLQPAAPEAIAAPAQPEAPAAPATNEAMGDPTPSGSQPIDVPQADPLPSQAPEEGDPSSAPEATPETAPQQ